MSRLLSDGMLTKVDGCAENDFPLKSQSREQQYTAPFGPVPPSKTVIAEPVFRAAKIVWSMSEATRSGLVGCRRTSHSAFGKASRACMATHSLVAVSVASSLGRIRTWQSWMRDCAAISSSSVDRTSNPIDDKRACSRDQAKRGLPATGRMFFLGKRFDPPRAGINPSITRRIVLEKWRAPGWSPVPLLAASPPKQREEITPGPPMKSYPGVLHGER